MRRKTFIFFVLPVILFGGGFLLRNQILVVGTKVCLNRTFAKELSYQKISASNGKVTIQGLQYRNEQIALILEKVELDVSPKSFINLWRKGFSSWKGALSTLKHYGNGLTIQNGMLQIDDQLYDFQFKGSAKKSEVGTLFIEDLLEINFLNLEHQLVANLVVENGSATRLLRLCTFAAPEYLTGLEVAKGQIELKANAVFKKNGELNKLASRFSCDNLEAQTPKFKVGATAKKLSGIVTYPASKEKLPLWKKMECKVHLEKGNLLWGDKLALLNLEGNLDLDPNMDPTLHLQGKLAGEGKTLNLELQGKGALHETQAYWLEFALNLNNAAGTKCGAFLSICRPEPKDLVVQLEASELLPTQVEMLKGYFAKSLPRLNDWEVKQGTVGGKLVALFEKGRLSHFEVQELVGKEIALASSSKQEPLYFSSIKGEGRVFDALNFEIVLPAHQLFTFVSPELKEMYETYRGDDTARLSMTVKFGSKEVETSAHVDFLELKQALQFGFKSKAALPTSWEEISEGWVRCEKINHMLYGPFIKYIQDDLNLYGTVDMSASFDGKKIDCIIQVDEFLSKHPLLDLKAAAIGEKGKTQGKATLRYEVATNILSGSLPIRQGQAYDRTYGLHFQDVNADLTLSSSGIKGHVSNTGIAYDGLNLLKKTHFDFVYGKEMSLTGLYAQIALESDKEYFVSAAKFDPSSLDFRLLQGKEELAHFTGNKEEIWKGVFNFKPLKEKFDIQFAFDPRKDVAVLNASGAGIHLLCKKQGAEYVLEKLEAQDFSLKGAFTKAETGFNVSNFELIRSTAALQGSGNFILDLPQGEQDFGLRADLTVALQMSAPFPLQVKTTRSFKAAYAPELGFVMSDMNFSGLGCQFNIGQLQYMNTKDKIAANKCTFKFSEEILKDALPAVLRDFKICKTLSGEVSYSLEKGKTDIEGFLKNEKGPIGISVNWKEQSGEVSLHRDELDENLVFHAHRDENGLHLDAVKGTFQGLTADLKANKEQLKGQVTIDSAAIRELVDLPFNRYVELWKATGNYQFDGFFTEANRLDNWSFKGKMKGRDLHLAGYQLHSLDAKIDVEPGKIAIENLDLSDEAGKLSAGEGVLTRSNEQWFFSFPTLEIRGFQPGSLTKTESPLIIKSAILRDVRGKIDDLKSITAKGNLRFSNIPKKGERVLPKNLPIQHLQKLGLDGAILIPAAGEMEYTIENGRCYLRELKSVFTDKRRSEFIAPRNASMGYLDFDGNFFINLSVKQNVVRSITSPLNLQVRGKWEEPQLIIAK